MKILFLTNLLPYPLDNGGKLKAIQHLRLFFKQDIMLIYYALKKQIFL